VPGDWCIDWTTTETNKNFTFDYIPAGETNACGTEFSDGDPSLAFQAGGRLRGDLVRERGGLDSHTTNTLRDRRALHPSNELNRGKRQMPALISSAMP
jgi:hypothetical protein